MFDNEEIDKIVSVLQNGGLTIMPTDTVWGVCCAAFHEEAVRKIAKIRERPKAIGMILLVSDIAQLGTYITKIHPKAQGLLDYHTRPLTIVYAHHQNIPSFLLNEAGALAVRVVKDPFCQRVIQAFEQPILMDMASLSGDDGPSNFESIPEDLLQLADYVAQYRRDEQKDQLPSVVVQVDDEGELEFLRK